MIENLYYILIFSVRSLGFTQPDQAMQGFLEVMNINVWKIQEFICDPDKNDSYPGNEQEWGFLIDHQSALDCLIRSLCYRGNLHVTCPHVMRDTWHVSRSCVMCVVLPHWLSLSWQGRIISTQWMYRELQLVTISTTIFINEKQIRKYSNYTYIHSYLKLHTFYIQTTYIHIYFVYI